MLHAPAGSWRARARLLAALVCGLLSVSATLFALDPALISVAWARPLNNTLTVTTFSDTGAGSLRDALGAAGAGDSINFSLPANAVIALNSELLITKSVTINGAMVVNLSIDGGYAGRAFNLSAPATIISLTVMRGINSTDALTLTSVAVISSLAEYQGGGV